MKKSLLVVAMTTALGSMPSFAVNVQGGSSNAANVTTGLSNFTLFTTGYSGLSLSGSDRIDLKYGPIQGSNTAIADTSAAATDSFGNHYLLGGHINWLAGIVLGGTKIAQVWNTSAAQGTAKFAVNTIRQMIDPPLPIMPAFGGLVIGQVANASGAPLAAGSGVYFGEWAPKGANANQANSTDLNMGSASRTVWYVGDNAVTTMPTAVNATYGVIGINGVGTSSGGTPSSLDLYKGNLVVNYGSGAGSITGSIVRGASNINFAGTAINSSGTFNNGSNIEGRFYNGAEALAGIYKGTNAADSVAFGGSKTSGTITP